MIYKEEEKLKLLNTFSKAKKNIIPDLRDPFSLPYNQGEILCLILDGLGNNTELVLERIKLNEKCCIKPSTSSFVLYDIIDTEVTYEIASFLIRSLLRLEKSIMKLALVGITPTGKKNIKKYVSEHGIELDILMDFFSGIEPAKEWLIN